MGWDGTGMNCCGMEWDGKEKYVPWTSLPITYKIVLSLYPSSNLLLVVIVVLQTKNKSRKKNKKKLILPNCLQQQAFLL